MKAREQDVELKPAMACLAGRIALWQIGSRGAGAPAVREFTRLLSKASHSALHWVGCGW